jgi:glycosyltransferase involved in cell wall biosynthesis
MTYPAAFAAKEMTGKPVVLHVHSTEFDRTLNGSTNQDIADIEYEGLQKADRIITVSNYTKEVICNKYAIDPYKVRVVHNGVDLSEQRITLFLMMS